MEPEGPPGPHHGHSHGPALPPSPAAADLVWMVVLGDGIHNLTDGLAIGGQRGGLWVVTGGREGVRTHGRYKEAKGRGYGVRRGM